VSAKESFICKGCNKSFFASPGMAVTKLGIVKVCSAECMIKIHNSAESCTLGELEKIEKRRHDN
jgi:hypothetical protein